ncbi:hypothetical protein SB85_00360 [Xanthomonas sacchari]|nr:hypothetical protein SB85_00360 [Xanthomonas sacchari]
MPAPLILAVRQQAATAAPGASRRQQRVCAEEGRTAEAQCLQHAGPGIDHRTDAGYAEDDQRHVAGGAYGHDQANMPTLQSLAQHEGVLRTDGDDQAGAGDEAGQQCLQPHSDEVLGHGASMLHASV